MILDNQNRNDLHSPGDGQRGRPGDEEIVCGDDADYVNGGPGDDSIWGGGGDDFLCGNEGYDFLHDRLVPVKVAIIRDCDLH